MTIPVISLWQPWASLIAFGEKHVETRSWPWRGDLPAFLAIHAAKKWDKELAKMCEDEPFASSLAKHVEHVKELPFGAVVAVVRLVECVSTNYMPVTFGRLESLESLTVKYLKVFPAEKSFGDYSVGRYAWAFDQRFVPEKPIPMVGQRGIWQWDNAPAEVVDWCKIVRNMTPATSRD